MTKVTGELISIDDSAYDGFNGMTVYGNTVQNLWVNPSGTVNGVTFTPNANGSISISGSPTGSKSLVDSEDIYVLIPNTKYTISIDRTLGTGSYVMLVGHDADGNQVPSNTAVVTLTGNETFETFTVPSGVVSCACRMQVNSNGTASGTYRVMLNEGSEAEPWCPPGLNSVGDDGSVDIVTAGKNLLARMGPSLPYTTAGITFSDNGDSGIRINGTATEAAYYNFFSNSPAKATRITPGEYTASLIGGGSGLNLSVEYFDGGIGGSRTSWLATNVPGVSNTGSIDRPVYLRPFLSVAKGKTVDTVVYPQLELGSTATDYEPPNITTTPIDLQGHTLNALPDGTRDELHIDGGGNVVLEKRTGIATAPTSEGSWTFEAEYGRGYFDIFPNAYGIAGEGALLCDKLPPREAGASATEGTYSLVAASSGYARVSTADALSELVPIAGGATYIYPRAKPQTIQLGKISLPKLRKKPLVNSIWANGTASATNFSLAPEIDYEYNQWSTYCDGFRTHGKHSYFDMGCCIAARDTGTPEKKSVTATVPYMSGFYDLSKLYGAIAFEARELMYRFEFVEDSRDELQRKKSQFLEWLSQVHDEEIADDDIPGRHFIGSLSEWEFEEGEEGQSGSLEVTFNCQPFLEADEDTTKTCNAGSNTVTVAGQAANAYAKTNSGTATIRIGGVTQSVGTTEIRLSVQLQSGDNAVTVTGSPVVLRWRELTV